MKVILINIFGGIVRCDVVVEGIIAAVNELNIKKQIVMRIKGNKAKEAKEMIEKSKMQLFWFDEVGEAVAKAISLAK